MGSGHNHDHSHEHSHEHNHDHTPPSKEDREIRLVGTLVLIGSVALAELVGGYFSGALALMADAFHMVSDAASIGITLGAIRFAKRRPDARHTFGYMRAEILAATVNAGLLIAVSIWIVQEAYERWWEPQPVHGALAVGIALLGLFTNLGSLKILGHHHEGDLNLRSAWLHVLSDTLGSLAALTAGLVALGGGPGWVDPVVSVGIAVLVLRSGWVLLLQCVDVLMERAPQGLDVEQVRAVMLKVEQVEEVHDLHVWSLSAGMVAMSGHVVVVGEGEGVIAELDQLLKKQFGIGHITIQLERSRCGGGCES